MLSNYPVQATDAPTCANKITIRRPCNLVCILSTSPFNYPNTQYDKMSNSSRQFSRLDEVGKYLTFW